MIFWKDCIPTGYLRSLMILKFCTNIAKNKHHTKFQCKPNAYVESLCDVLFAALNVELAGSGSCDAAAENVVEGSV